MIRFSGCVAEYSRRTCGRERANGRSAGDSHGAAHRLASLAEIGECGLDLREQPLSARQEIGPGAREFNGARGALDELHAEVRLQGQHALVITGGNISKAAEVLGVTHPPLYDLMKHIGAEGRSSRLGGVRGTRATYSWAHPANPPRHPPSTGQH